VPAAAARIQPNTQNDVGLALGDRTTYSPAITNATRETINAHSITSAWLLHEVGARRWPLPTPRNEMAS
jgi:hypothetical protein